MLCAGDPTLEAEVLQLLEQDDRAEGFLERAAPLPAEEEIVEPARAGQRLGPYRILQLLGEGGMGAVYLASRDDSAFELQVAIKVLRQREASPRATLRFEQERQILAGLDHPGIARLLDGGTTDEGLPYVVMEYVDGEAIDVASARRALTVRDRLELMISVCEAVSSAHRQLVVHRDLKPSNILLDRRGRIKLLDFGIAKLIDGDGAEAETATWDRRLTPAYATPELLRAERVTVASDVHQLGTVLYKLLTGELPHPRRGGSLLDRERDLMEREPRPPSALTPRIGADLDAIVLKALRPEPEKRYGSVEALAGDLRRYLDGFPVSARRGSHLYRVGKFLRRRWLPVSAAVAVLALALAFAISTVNQARRNQRSLDRLLAMESFLTGLFWTSTPEVSKGRDILVEELLQRGERRLEEAPPEDVGTRALLHSLFGRIALHLGQLDQAEVHFEQATRAYRHLPSDRTTRVATARLLREQARLILFRDEDFERARDLALEAHETAAPWLPDEPGVELELINALGEIHCWFGRWGEAEPWVARAGGLAARVGPAQGHEIAIALSMQATLAKHHEQDLDKAMVLYGRALDIFRRFEGEVHPNIANALNQLGVIAREAEDPATALQHFGRSLEMRRQLYPASSWHLGQSLYQVASMHRALGELAEADALMSEALEIYRADPARGPTMSRTVFLLLHLAEIRLDRGQPREVERMLAELPAAWWGAEHRDPKLVPWARAVRGMAQSRLGEPERGREAVDSAWRELVGQLGEGHGLVRKIGAWRDSLIDSGDVSRVSRRDGKAPPRS